MLLSVIVPCYNSEKTIEKCLSSITCEAQEDIEVIVVNDGSTDCTRDIVKKCKKKADNIILLEKSNSGVGSARNFGLEHSSGDYVCFVDSDDYVSDNFIKVLTQKADADIVAGGRATYYEGNFVKKKCAPNTHIVDDLAELVKLVLLGKYNAHTVSAKAYRRAMLNDSNIRFQEGVIFEDLLFSFDAMLCAKSVTFWTEVIYFYMMRPESLITTVNEHQITDFLHAKRHIAEVISQADMSEVTRIEWYFFLSKALMRFTRLYCNSENISKQLFSQGTSEIASEMNTLIEKFQL